MIEELMIARYVMACNYFMLVITMIVIIYRIIRLQKNERKRQLYFSFPMIMFCINAFLFYTYTFVHTNHSYIPQYYYFAWGASIILHAILNALGMELTRLKLDGH